MEKDLLRIRRHLSHLQKHHMDLPLPRHMDLRMVPLPRHMVLLHHRRMDLRLHHHRMDLMEEDPHPIHLIRTTLTINGEQNPQKNL